MGHADIFDEAMIGTAIVVHKMIDVMMDNKIMLHTSDTITDEEYFFSDPISLIMC